ncbi:MAG: DUF4912 domain-containing protein [Pirellulales bacterium]|nr:DUF4912 domain-containing protein [Pirellulales bacterium]
MTAADLKSRTVRDLASMAKKRKVPGWHSMRKDDLVKALLRRVRAERRKSAGKNGADKRSASGRRETQSQTRHSESKDLTFQNLCEGNGKVKDRLVVMVRDSYWLHAYWELSRKSVERATVALGQRWHGAKPVLRVCEVLREGVTTSTRQPIRDIEIHGGVNNWYIDVGDPPKSIQVDIGYLTTEGKFFCLARSNVVSTPPAAAGDAFDRNWAEVAKDYERIFALSGGYSQPESATDLKELLEERLQRPIGDPVSVQFGPGASGHSADEEDFEFQVDTELIVHGVTQPDAHVTLRGEPVRLRSDGSFAVRFNLPDRRHVLPMVASSRNGAEQRTIVLAIDRNTKVMEPISHDPAE